MPSFNDIVSEAQQIKHPTSLVRTKYMQILKKYTNRNVIAYYTSFVNNPSLDGSSIDDMDKNAFMQVVSKMDKSLGLDLILHTPGGDMAATESLVVYLKSLFNNDFRVIVPQSAFSAGTMIALASKEIIMGKQSNLGPIDPQIGHTSCEAIIEEFERAKQDVLNNPDTIRIWGPIISKYPPSFLGECERGIKLASKIVTYWLEDNMLKDYNDSKQRAETIVKTLSSHNSTYAHSRHIHIDELRSLGINVKALERMDNRGIDGCKDLQDCILSIHHSFMFTLMSSSIVKIIENCDGEAFIKSIRA